MAYTELQDLSTMDLETLLKFPSLDTPIFYPVMLFVIFTIFTLGTYFRELGRGEKGNFFSSLLVGGYVTTAMALIMSYIGLIQTAVFVIVIVIALIFQVIFLLTKKD